MSQLTDYEKYHLHDYVYSKKEMDTKLSTLIQTNISEFYVNQYLELYAECIYTLNILYSHHIVMDASSRKVSKLYDQTLSENNCSQTNTQLQPIVCTKNNKINKRYYLEFNGSQRMISNINLNPKPGDKDIVNIFVVYKLNNHGSSGTWRNGIFGHDNGGHDKFVAFSSTGILAISGTKNNFITIGGDFNGKTKHADYQINANAGKLNKWCCLSIHWNEPSKTNGSSVWCNGKKLCNFTSKTSVGSKQMTFGDLDPSGIAGLNGSITLFSLYKAFEMSDDIIKLHHKVFMDRYLINKQSN